jgi:hypothetical protein
MPPAVTFDPTPAVAPGPPRRERAARLPDGDACANLHRGMRRLVDSTHLVCIGTDAIGHTSAQGEWDLAFSRETDRIEAGTRIVVHERVRFRADAAGLRTLALAMLAGAKELEAIEAHMTPIDAGSRVDLDYLETITLTSDGVGPSYDSHLYVERPA